MDLKRSFPYSSLNGEAQASCRSAEKRKERTCLALRDIEIHEKDSSSLSAPAKDFNAEIADDFN
jgi:hypothetical protein